MNLAESVGHFVKALTRGGARNLAARAVVTPFRHQLWLGSARPHQPFDFESEGVTLRGWRFPHGGKRRRGRVVFLHGHSDNRHLSAYAAGQLCPRGWEVVAWDSRAHGESGGDACTFGWLEKRDVSKALDLLGDEPAFLVGTSLGGAVALQAAAIDARIAGVVAHAPYTDLKSAIADRTGFLPRRFVSKAVARAEAQHGFCADEVSPLCAAPKVKAPVLLIHGEHDRWTPPRHSALIYEALAGPKQLFTVEGGHDDVIRFPVVWEKIQRWLARAG